MAQGAKVGFELQPSTTSSLPSGRGAVRLARLHGVQEVGGSNPLAPTLYNIYILFSPRTGHYYVGSTAQLDRRLRQHNAGASLSTRAGRPWELVHSQACATRSDAVRLESKIKARGIRRYLVDIAAVAQP